MTRITLAKSAGFCFGVSRSVVRAEKRLESGPCKGLGPLIHNEEVGASLAARGLEVISSPEEAGPGDRVLIRSHGVSRAVEDALRAAGAEITDATCPNVARIHRLMAEAPASGRQVIAVGAADQPEVPAICGLFTDTVPTADAG